MTTILEQMKKELNEYNEIRYFALNYQITGMSNEIVLDLIDYASRRLEANSNTGYVIAADKKITQAKKIAQSEFFNDIKEIAKEEEMSWLIDEIEKLDKNHATRKG